jgi:hypothetical protein
MRAAPLTLPKPAELWIGWRQRYDGPLAEAAIIQLERMENRTICHREVPTPYSGYVEVSFGGRMDALFDRHEIYGKIHWELCFIRPPSGDLLELFPVHDYMPLAVAAIRAVVALGDGKEARMARHEIRAARDAERAARQLALFSD